MIKRFVTFLVVLAVAIGAVAAWAWRDYQHYIHSPANINEPTSYLVKKGQYYNALVDDLNDKSIIGNALYMRVLARIEPALSSIKAGEYRLEPGMSPHDIVKKIANGDTVRYQFTIIEGSRWSDLRASLAKETMLGQSLEGKSDEQVLEALGLEAKSPEGMFLAETYQFERGMSDIDLLARANKALQNTLDAAWASRREKLPLNSPYDALILASIVEKETAVPEERPRIAGVFTRRLERGMRLQTDPTVIYGMGDAYKGNIRRSDLRKATPYNTYVINGLPPTPIAMVGPDAIQAAVSPASGNELYFVARGDGSHHFSATLTEHNKAVARYQLKRTKNYRSSPEN
ncbi:protein YceG like [Marinobacterium lacunae]|uniref:Endolytic murein transglycosylase n=1 Tax=Marinobacterium lacunae TaxID=1232683 RepID=A0A081FTN7_9GAMM|nr:endolytic transglycosylase MltG [Marinobacterium lacunae]KEA61892.1 protein YceG like [Marinobacterium lacunae]